MERKYERYLELEKSDIQSVAEQLDPNSKMEFYDNIASWASEQIEEAMADASLELQYYDYD